LTRGFVAVTIEAMSHHCTTEPALNIEPSINERQALKAAAARLQNEFPDALDTEAVERLVYCSYQTLAADVIVSMGCGDACPISPGRR